MGTSERSDRAPNTTPVENRPPPSSRTHLLDELPPLQLYWGLTPRLKSSRPNCTQWELLHNAREGCQVSSSRDCRRTLCFHFYLFAKVFWCIYIFGLPRHRNKTKPSIVLTPVEQKKRVRKGLSFPTRTNEHLVSRFRTLWDFTNINIRSKHDALFLKRVFDFPPLSFINNSRYWRPKTEEKSGPVSYSHYYKTQSILLLNKFT